MAINERLIGYVMACVLTLPLIKPVLAEVNSFNSEKKSPVATAGNVALSRVAQMLFENGHKTCANDLNEIVKYVHSNDGDYGMHNQWSASNPDKRTAVAVTSEAFSDGIMFTTFTSTLDATGKCSLTATQIMPLTDTCTSVREKTLKEWTYKGELGKSTAIYEMPNNENQTMYLTSYQGGCLLIKLNNYQF